MNKFTLILLCLCFTAFFSSCEDNAISSDFGSSWSINFTSDNSTYAASKVFETDGEGNFDTPIEFVYNDGKLQYFTYRLRGQIFYEGDEGTIDNAEILDSAGNIIGRFDGLMSLNNGNGTWQITSGVTGSGDWTLVRQ